MQQLANTKNNQQATRHFINRIFPPGINRMTKRRDTGYYTAKPGKGACEYPRHHDDAVKFAKSRLWSERRKDSNKKQQGDRVGNGE